MSPAADVIPTSSRILWVDALRGFAILGLLLVHQSELFELYWLKATPSLVHEVTFALFAGKAFALLALCFGFSFYIQSASAQARGEAFAPRFAWRLILLALIGTAHGIIYRGDIIVVLALMGFVLIPLDRVRNPRWLMAIAALCFLQPILIARIASGLMGGEWGMSQPDFYTDPSLAENLKGSLWTTLTTNAGPGQLSKWNFYIESGRCFQIIGLFLVGSVMGRSGLFAQAENSAGSAVKWAVVSAMAVAALATVEARLPEDMGPSFYTAMLVGSWVDIAGMALSFWLVAIAWNSAARPLVALLVPAGRMSLTLYLSQSLLLVPFFYPFGAGAHAWISQGASVTLGLGVFVAQMLFAHWWFARYRYGPVEWLWRAATQLDLRLPNRV
jgi:uncharacterized protein